MKLILLLACAVPAFSHALSMSSGDLVLSGVRASYKLQIPMFELQHVPHPDVALPDSIRLEGAQRTSSHCWQESGNYRCDMEWQYPAPPDTIKVVCWLGRVTVLNHVHVLHASDGQGIDQAVFQGAVEESTLVFRQEGPLLSALRSRPSMLLMLLLVALGIFTLHSGWAGFGAASVGFTGATLQPFAFTPAFLEAAVALLSAYAAFEVLFLPPNRWRSLLALLLGIAAGLYLSVLVTDLASRELLGLSVVLLGAVAARLWRHSLRAVSYGLLAVGTVLDGCSTALTTHEGAAAVRTAQQCATRRSQQLYPPLRLLPNPQPLVPC